jgi:hypothetical protein
MQMRMPFLFVVLVVLTASCTGYRTSHSVAVDSAKPLTPKFVSGVTNALERSETFLELRRKAEKPIVFISEEENGWVVVDIGNQSRDFFHRWATLKVETKTGKILKLGTDEGLEDKWIVEYEAPN